MRSEGMTRRVVCELWKLGEAEVGERRGRQKRGKGDLNKLIKILIKILIIKE